MMRRLLGIALALATVTPVAHAGENDLVLSRLGQIDASGTTVIPNNQDFRSLVSEFGVAIAPRLMSPADTLGYSGFQFSVDYAFTTINKDASYWCATEQTGSCPGSKGNGYLGTFGMFVRKGLWLPLPSFEVGGGFVNVTGTSSMVAAQAYAKFALHEGFHDWPIPSVAVRGAGSRLMGSEQIDLTVASLDVSASKSFGVAGTVNVTPYAGWNYLWIVPRSEVIDKTPNVDAFTTPGDVNKNFVFPDQANITRQRIFLGAKIKYYVFAISLEWDIALAGHSVDDRTGTDLKCDMAGPNQLGSCDAQDKAKSQQTFNLAISLDF